MAKSNSHEAKYMRRQRAAGYTRINVVLSPSDMARVGQLMRVHGSSRQEAIRRAIKLAAPSPDDTGLSGKVKT